MATTCVWNGINNTKHSLNGS